MNKKKNKRIYSKNKNIYVKLPKRPANSMELISSMYSIENCWTNFISEVVCGGMQLALPHNQNLSYIMSEIHDNNLMKEFLMKLMSIPSYNPFIDSIPEEELNSNMRSYINKKQKFINSYFGHKKEVSMGKLRILEVYNDNKIDIISLIDDYDLIVLFNSYSISFNLNKKSKDKLDLNCLYLALMDEEKNKWFIHGNKLLLKTVKGQKTSLNISSYKEIITTLIKD